MPTLTTWPPKKRMKCLKIPEWVEGGVAVVMRMNRA